MTQERRYKKVEVSPELLTNFFQESDRYFTVADGIPEDASFVRVLEDHETGNLWIVFEHESFEPIGEGAEIPKMLVAFNSVAPEAVDVHGDDRNE